MRKAVDLIRAGRCEPPRRESCALRASPCGHRPLRQLPVHNEKPPGRILHELEPVDDLADGGLFLDLLGDEPLQEDRCRVIAFRVGEARQLVDGVGDLLLMLVGVSEGGSSMFLFDPGVTLNDVVRAVNQVGAGPSDLVAILEALKQAGALKAELIVI